MARSGFLRWARTGAAVAMLAATVVAAGDMASSASAAGGDAGGGDAAGWRVMTGSLPDGTRCLELELAGAGRSGCVARTGGGQPALDKVVSWTRGGTTVVAGWAPPGSAAVLYSAGGNTGRLALTVDGGRRVFAGPVPIRVGRMELRAVDSGGRTLASATGTLVDTARVLAAASPTPAPAPPSSGTRDEVYNPQQWDVAFTSTCSATIRQHSVRKTNGMVEAHSRTSDTPTADCLYLRATTYAKLLGDPVSISKSGGDDSGDAGTFGNLYASRHYVRSSGTICRQWELTPFDFGVHTIDNTCP